MISWPKPAPPPVAPVFKERQILFNVFGAARFFLFFPFFFLLPGPAAARGALERDRDATRVAEAAARENCRIFARDGDVFGLLVNFAGGGR